MCVWICDSMSTELFARVVTQFPRFYPTKPLLNYENWFPVLHHIVFEVCTLTIRGLSVKLNLSRNCTGLNLNLMKIEMLNWN